MNASRTSIGSVIGGALLILFGLLTLAGQVVGGQIWESLWPLIIIGVGAVFFIAAFVGRNRADALGVPAGDTAALAIPGSIITTVGLILWLQTLFGHFESWSYGWTVILIAVGFGIFVMGWLQSDAERRASGVKVMQIGLVMFIIFGAFFETLFRSFAGSQYVFPAALIVLGLFLLIRRLLPQAGPKHV